MKKNIAFVQSMFPNALCVERYSFSLLRKMKYHAIHINESDAYRHIAIGNTKYDAWRKAAEWVKEEYRQLEEMKQLQSP